MRLLILSLVAATVLSACGGGHSRQASIAGVDAITANDKAVLDQRLGADGRLAFLHPATTYTAHDGQLDIVVGAADDSDDDLRYLLSHQGRVALTGEWGRVWLDRSGIADVQVAMGQNGQPVLRFSLTPAGQQRLASFTTQDAVGSTMHLKLDDETLVSARLVEPISGTSVQLNMQRPVAEMLLLAQVIRSGPLSFKPGP